MANQFDFTTWRKGKKVRRGSKIEVCPKCGRKAMATHYPAQQGMKAHSEYVHSAESGLGGLFLMIRESCTVIEDQRDASALEEDGGMHDENNNALGELDAYCRAMGYEPERHTDPRVAIKPDGGLKPKSEPDDDLPWGVQEPPQDYRIYNRRQPDGSFRPLSGFFDAPFEHHPDPRVAIKSNSGLEPKSEMTPAELAVKTGHAILIRDTASPMLMKWAEAEASRQNWDALAETLTTWRPQTWRVSNNRWGWLAVELRSPCICIYDPVTLRPAKSDNPVVERIGAALHPRPIANQKPHDFFRTGKTWRPFGKRIATGEAENYTVHRARRERHCVKGCLIPKGAAYMDYWLAGQKHDSYCRVHAPFRFEVAENPQPDAPGTILVAGVPCIRNRADQLYVGDVLVDTDTRVNADGSLREVARRRTVLYVGPAHHDEHKVTLVIKSEFNTDAGEWLKDHPFVVEIRTP